MTLEEAIKGLEEIKDGRRHTFLPSSQDALGLGTGALKRLKKLRDNYSPYSIAPLPGETEEEP